MSEPSPPRLIAYLEDRLIAMTVWKDELIVATEGGVWRCVHGKFVPIPFDPKAKPPMVEIK